ncbi:MAG: NfeD family protein [Spirochaetales bacterium]|nr:NfeD family protein [Spirochaetales bacterium]
MKKWVFVCLLVSLLSLALLPADSFEDIDEGPVFLIPVIQDIDPFLVVFLKRAMVKAKEAQSPLIIFQLNTYGGRVDSALEIASLIGSADWAETIAYIPSESGGTGVSWSAGALISFSCNRIIMDGGTSIGAAAPVYQSTEGMVMAEEKTVSAVRGQMAALAEKNGYPPSVALAMVDKDVELIEVETDDGLRLKTPEEIKEMTRLNGNEPIQGKQISAPSKLLTLTAGEMEKYGISSATLSGLDSLYEFLNVDGDKIIMAEKDRADTLVAYLSSAALTSLLVMVGMVALYLEITSPGFGVPGTIGLISFAIVFSTSVLMGNLESLELLLFLGGIILLLVEIFLIPGFGVTGLGGIVLILTSLVLTRQDFIIPEFDWQWKLLRHNILYISLGLFGALFLIALLMMRLPKSPLFNRLVLHNKSKPANPKIAPNREEEKSHLGETGRALTDLRPVGKADFKGMVLIVQTDGEYINKDSEVVVTREEGLRLIVKGR